MATYDIGSNLTVGSYQLLAQHNINVLGDNIANASTAGYKQTEFSFQSALATANMAVGNSEVFTQGSITNNSNPLDVAINGQGFFVCQTLSGQTEYTRDGQFSLDASGNLMTSTGQYVIGTDGKTINPSSLAAANAPTGTNNGVAPTYTGFTMTATGGIAITYSDGSSLTVPAPASLSAGVASAAELGAANVPLTTALGVAYTALTAPTYTGFTQNATGTVLSYSDGQTVTIPLITAKNTITAVAAGTAPVNSPAGTNVLQVTFTDMSSGVAVLKKVNIPAPATAGTAAAASTGLAGFSVSGTTLTWTNGNGSNISSIPETSAGLAISSTGELVVTGAPSAPVAGALGGAQGIALVNFQNPNGLKQLQPGVWGWTASASPAPPALTRPGDPGLGVLQGSALESSNADITALMVQLLEGQRQYQATSQALKTQDQDMQTMINLR